MTQPTPAEFIEQPPAADLETQAAKLAATTGVPLDVVRVLLDAQDRQHGEAIGTLRYDPATKAVAHRVMDREIPKWLVSHPTLGIFYEMAPTKHDWVLLEVPTEA